MAITISALPDNIVIRILSYLPVRTQFCTRRVSRRFLTLALASFSTIEEFDSERNLVSQPLAYSSFHMDTIVRDSLCALGKVVGRQIRRLSVKLSLCSANDIYCMASIIADNFPNVEKLTITCGAFFALDVELRLPNLRSLTLAFEHNIGHLPYVEVSVLKTLPRLEVLNAHLRIDSGRRLSPVNGTWIRLILTRLNSCSAIDVELVHGLTYELRHRQFCCILGNRSSDDASSKVMRVMQRCDRVFGLRLGWFRPCDLPRLLPYPTMITELRLRVRVSDVPPITDDSWVTATHHLAELVHLKSLEFKLDKLCYDILPATFFSFLNSTTQLVRLYVITVPDFQSTSIGYISNDCRLESLHLVYTSATSVSGLSTLLDKAQILQQLRSFVFYGTEPALALERSGVYTKMIGVLQHCPNLEMLHIIDSRHLFVLSALLAKVESSCINSLKKVLLLPPNRHPVYNPLLFIEARRKLFVSQYSRVNPDAGWVDVRAHSCDLFNILPSEAYFYLARIRFTAPSIPLQKVYNQVQLNLSGFP